MASESALEILTDILDDFNTKFCHLLRMGVDNQALNGRTGFPVSASYVHVITSNCLILSAVFILSLAHKGRKMLTNFAMTSSRINQSGCWTMQAMLFLPEIKCLFSMWDKLQGTLCLWSLWNNRKVPFCNAALLASCITFFKHICIAKLLFCR